MRILSFRASLKTSSRLFCVFLVLIVITLQGALIANEREMQRKQTFERGVIAHPDQSENRIEFFYLLPNKEGPFPVLFLLTGWQPEENSKGGKELAEFGYLHRLTAEGIAAVSISVPGYGNSDGKRDFGGYYSQRAICAVIDHFNQHPLIDSSRVGIYGISKGASLGAMVSALYPAVKLQILESGFYDLLTSPWPMPQYLNTIHDNLKKVCDTPDSLMSRSAVYYADKIKATTLILHGEFDDRRGLSSARDLHKKLINYGVSSKLKIYPNATHCLTSEKWEEILSFLRFHFLNICGLGIKISDPSPAIQITEIFPGSPAALSGKLKIGDVILRVAPNDDAREIDVFRMPKNELLPLILGKPRTKVRLHVQHFDQTYEDIVIERAFYNL